MVQEVPFWLEQFPVVLGMALVKVYSVSQITCGVT